MSSTTIDTIVKEINSKLGAILGVRVYMGVVDGLGTLIYIDDELEQFKDFILNFIKNNFKYLRIGEHSLPISGKNIIFFRYQKVMVILYSTKGRIGQLLSFKSIMPEYQAYFDKIVGDTEIIPTSTELETKPSPKPEITPKVPIKIKDKNIFSRSNALYRTIYPIKSKRLKEKEKFSLVESIILNHCDGENSISDIYDKLDMSQDEYIKEIYNLYKSNKITIPNFELFPLVCPICNNEMNKLIPIEFLKISPKSYIRFQVDPTSCNHTSYVILDKKGKIKSKPILKISDLNDSIDFSSLSLEKLIQFFGQDVFFSIFHAIFFKYPIIFLESNKFAEQICNYMKKFFPQIEYENEIKSLSQKEYFRTSKINADYLVIDLVSNIIVNEPYENSDLDFELQIFRKVLQERDENVQILKTHSEYERHILLIETILSEIEIYKQIKENELINLMKTKHNIILKSSEIPVIKELANVYYSVDIHKKLIQ
ncbi:MAG: hypothetical protein ACFFD2_10400 [Promethearchaeota archaeon]